MLTLALAPREVEVPCLLPFLKSRRISSSVAALIATVDGCCCCCTVSDTAVTVEEFKMLLRRPMASLSGSLSTILSFLSWSCRLNCASPMYIKKDNQSGRGILAVLPFQSNSFPFQANSLTHTYKLSYTHIYTLLHTHTNSLTHTSILSYIYYQVRQNNSMCEWEYMCV